MNENERERLLEIQEQNQPQPEYGVETAGREYPLCDRWEVWVDWVDR